MYYQKITQPKQKMNNNHEAGKLFSIKWCARFLSVYRIFKQTKRVVFLQFRVYSDTVRRFVARENYFQEKNQLSD